MKRVKVLSTTTSRPDYLLCPACGSGELRHQERRVWLATCDSCDSTFDRGVLRTLEQIVILPDALGKHACEECDHPEMRCLPDETFHCPACGSEVLPVTGPTLESS
jgi:ribosomal protein L37AE/L43A